MQLVSLGGFNLRFVWTPKSEFFQHHNVKFVVQYLQHIKCSVYVLFVITFSLRCDFFFFFFFFFCCHYSYAYSWFFLLVFIKVSFHLFSLLFSSIVDLEKEMATHSSVLAWRIPGKGEPGGLPSLGSHRVGHDWSDLAAA